MSPGDTTGKLILKIVLFSVVGFVIWLAIIVVVWFVLGTLGLETDLIALVESLSTAFAAAAVFGAGVLAVNELQEASTMRHIAVLNQLFEDLNSEENIAARRWIYQKLPDDPEEGLATLPPEGQAAIKRVLNTLDHVAFLTQPGWVDEEMVMPWMNPMVVKVWAKLKPYVAHERRRRGEPDYYEHAEQLAERCTEWRKRRFGEEATSTWLGDAL